MDLHLDRCHHPIITHVDSFLPLDLVPCHLVKLNLPRLPRRLRYQPARTIPAMTTTLCSPWTMNIANRVENKAPLYILSCSSRVLSVYQLFASFVSVFSFVWCLCLFVCLFVCCGRIVHLHVKMPEKSFGSTPPSMCMQKEKALMCEPGLS